MIDVSDVVRLYSGDCHVEYRIIPSFPDYAAGSDGSIWSFKSGEWVKMRQTVLNRKRNINGRFVPYLRLALSKNNRGYTVYSHVLVAEAFLGPKPSGMETRHLDGNPQNNCLFNLQYGTPQQNTDDRRRHGSIKWGEDNPVAIFTTEQVRQIHEMLADDMTFSEIGAKFGVGKTTIQGIANGDNWSHITPRRPRIEGRRAGERSKSAKLKESQVREIKRLISHGEQLNRIAVKFGVNACTVADIKAGRTWRSVQ